MESTTVLLRANFTSKQSRKQVSSSSVPILKKVLKTLQELREERKKAMMTAIRGAKLDLFKKFLKDTTLPIELKELDKAYPILAVAADGFATSDRRVMLLDLIWKGARLDTQDKKGRSSIMVSSLRGSLELVEILAKHNASLDLIDNDGRTAVMLAASKNQFVCVHMLASNNANLNIQEKKEKVPTAWPLV
eukprot:TRINITY_DN6097_c0_g2_i1.p1 TRINITY_DN6097_c0_g2~~TRINITY_DN6097_c0_g2_i1.p1  ORF type:complete len:191 (-),score=37.33 TRINITY_DN6097_c0_g2_i1:27-599(-)